MRGQWRLGWAAFLLLAISCKRPDLPPPVPPDDVAAIYEEARQRTVPDPVRARFQVRLRSRPLGLAGTTTGGLIIDRPGSGRIDLFGPLGGTLATLASDGEALSVLLVGERRHLLGDDAEQVLRETTGGVAGIDDLLALLVGDLPLPEARVVALGLSDGLPGVILEGPQNTRVHLVFDPERATLRSAVAQDAEERVLLVALYEDFVPHDDGWLPSRIDLYVPSIDLSVEARYRNWETLDEAPPVFAIETPAGYVLEPLETVVRRLVDEMARR